MAEKEDFEIKIGYVLGLVSILIIFISPIAGLIAGIIGLKLSDGQTNLSKRAKKINKIGITLNAIVLIITIIYIVLNSLGYLPSIPGVQ